MFLRTSSLKQLILFRAAENIPCCVLKNTSPKFQFVVCEWWDCHNIDKQYSGCQARWQPLYCPHVCLPYSCQVCGISPITDSYFFALLRKNAAFAAKYQNWFCLSRSFAVSLREGFSLSNANHGKCLNIHTVSIG